MRQSQIITQNNNIKRFSDAILLLLYIYCRYGLKIECDNNRNLNLPNRRTSSSEAVGSVVTVSRDLCVFLRCQGF